MQRALVAAGSLLFALVAANVAVAETPHPGLAKKCISVGDWATAVHAKSTGVAIGVLADVDGIEAKQVVARVNAEPPQTHMTADHIVVLGAKSLATNEPEPYVLVAFFNEGCMIASGRADPKGIAGLLEGEST